MTEHYIHAAAIGATILPGATGQTIERQRDHHAPESPGNVWNRLRSIKRQVGLVSLTSGGVAAILGLMPQGSGPTQLPVPCMALGANPLVLWAVANQDNVPLLEQTNLHEKISIAKGVLALRRLSWREAGEPVLATMTAWPLSADGEASYWSMTAEAAPTAPPVDADYTLDSLTIGETPVAPFTDLEVEIDCPWTPRFKNPKSRYPDYIAGAGSRGICNVRIGWRSLDRSLLRSFGEGFSGGAVQVVELILRDYANMAQRGSNVFKLKLNCVIEAAQAEDARPSTVQVTCHSISTDGTNPFLWGYA